ncbi:MAG TPA: type IV pilus secretin PilQ [Polyangiaceae bacterium]
MACPVTVVAEPSKKTHATHIAVLEGTQGGAHISIEFTRPPTYTARLEQGGRRLVLDVPNADLRGVPAALTNQVGVVGGVMAQTFKTKQGTTTRFLITLLEACKYGVNVDENRLLVDFVPGGSGVIDSPKQSRPAPVRAKRRQLAVTDVKYEHAALSYQVVIGVDGSPEYRQDNATPGQSSLILRRTKLPEALMRTLDVTAFGGGLRSISSYSKNGNVVIEVERSAELTSKVERRGDALVWSFFKPGSLPASMTGVARDGGIARRAKTVYVEEGFEDVPEVHSGYSPSAGEVQAEQSPAEEAQGFASPVLGQQRFTGRRIDLDLKDADIHNVLRLLADVGRVNIITADNVQGSVTIRMRNVPWDQALDVALQTKGLGMVRQGNMIRVAPLSDLEREREMELERRKQEVQLAPLETRLIPISYADANDIRDRAQPMLSGRGTIAVDERTNMMIVRDVAGNLNQIESLVRSLDTQTPQVLVEARIVEATSRYLHDVGIQWGGDATFSPATGNPTGLAFPSAVGVAGGASDAQTPTAGLSPFTSNVANPNFAVNLPAVVGTGSGGALGLTFGSIDNTINLAVRLSAAESSGMLRILSSPRVLTLDNKVARIAQGTLIPFSQVSAQGVQTTFQEAKLQLLVQPHVTADGSVSLNVKINRDEPDFNQTSARGDPTILKREAETTLLVMDGHTAVIGGIFTRNTGRNLDQVPFFGDIPLIGLLFQRRRASDSRSELVIFITPRIVNRAEALGR